MFLYFIPEHPRGVVTRADMEAAGLGHALGEGDPDSRKVTAAGPGGAPGFVVAVQPPADAPADCRVDTLYEPAKQVWRKGPGGKYFVGHYKARRPAPASLRRPKLIDGELTRFRDDREWLIPVARSIVRGSTLPKEMVLGEDLQTWEHRELPEFLSLCADAEKVFGVIAGAAPDEGGDVTWAMDRSEAMRICVSALAVNYRVGPLEVSMLGLTDGDVWQVLRAVCDVPMVERVLADRQKKSGAASGSSPTAAGSPGTSPDTCPPSAT